MTKKPTEAQIKDIAQNCLMGMLSFVHKETLEIEVYPDVTHIIDFDENDELWAETKNKLDENMADYIEIEPMASFESYKLLENFVLVVDDEALQDDLQAALERRKPFRNFKHIVDNSNYRQAWFDFELEQTMEYVRKNLHLK